MLKGEAVGEAYNCQAIYGDAPPKPAESPARRSTFTPWLVHQEICRVIQLTQGSTFIIIELI